MATVTAFVPVDMTNVNLFRITAGASTAGAYSNVAFNGNLYPTAVEVDWAYNGGYFASLFGGIGITTGIVGGTYAITGGTLTGYMELYASGGQWVPSYAVEGISFPAVALYNATQTQSTADDLIDIAAALAGDDTVLGSSGNDTMYAGSGNDTFRGGGGNDAFDGGPGIDTAVYAGGRAQYIVTQNANQTITVSDTVSGRDGTDIIQSTEQVRFSDYTLVFDLATSQDALVYRLYQAAYARTPDNSGFRYWATVADQTNMSAVALADQFLGAPEFMQKYGVLDDQGYASAMYTNILGRTPDPSGLAYWVDQLTKGMAKDQLLVAFATSPENIQLTGAHMSNGYWTT